MWESDVDDFGATIAQAVDRRVERAQHLAVHAVAQDLARNADAQAGYVTAERPAIIRDRLRCGSRIVRILSGDYFEHQRRVGDASRQWTYLVERRRKGEQTVARHATV